jgi:hypothetical protein
LIDLAWKSTSESPIGSVTEDERAVDVEGVMFTGVNAILEKPMGFLRCLG